MGATLHRRQFVIGPAPVRPDHGWQCEETADRLWLSFSPDLPVLRVDDRRGVRRHVLGRAVPADGSEPSVAASLAELDSIRPANAYRRWAGRWLLVGDGVVHADACCALGCFYRRVGEAVWASSSPALINDLPGVAPAEAIGPPLLAIGKGMDWYPPPASRFAGIARLLPSQKLDLRSGRVEARPLPSPLDPPPAYEDSVARAADLLTATVAAYAADAEHVWVPLTGGYDSRLVLAAAVAAGVPAVTYTFERPGMSAGDRDLPPRLAGEAGLPHRWLRPRRAANEERRLLFDVHTARHSVEIDREYFARGAWEEVPESAVLLRGGVFEVARGFYHHRFPPLLPSDEGAFTLLSEVFQFDRFHRGSRTHRRGAADYLAWLRETPSGTLDWRDRMYLEQTMGGWMASAAQGLDLFSPELAYPANSHELLATLLSIDPGLRRESRHHVDIIRRLAPPLAEIPFNPEPPLRARLAALARREAHDLITYPGKGRYFQHRIRWARRQLDRRFA